MSKAAVLDKPQQTNGSPDIPPSELYAGPALVLAGLRPGIFAGLPGVDVSVRARHQSQRQKFNDAVKTASKDASALLDAVQGRVASLPEVKRLAALEANLAGAKAELAKVIADGQLAKQEARKALSMLESAAPHEARVRESEAEAKSIGERIRMIDALVSTAKAVADPAAAKVVEDEKKRHYPAAVRRMKEVEESLASAVWEFAADLMAARAAVEIFAPGVAAFSDSFITQMDESIRGQFASVERAHKDAMDNPKKPNTVL